MKLWKIGMYIAILVLALLSFGFAEGTIPIDSAHFPDSSFRSYVKSSFDKDGDNSLSPDETALATEIYVPYKGITTLNYVCRIP